MPSYEGQRTYAPRHQAGHMTATDQTVQREKKCLPGGRSLIASPLSMVFCRRPGSRFSPRSE
jgi:hypothetical protein